MTSLPAGSIAGSPPSNPVTEPPRASANACTVRITPPFWPLQWPPMSDPSHLPDRVRLVVIFGGKSPEHDVSRSSAREVIAALDPNRYDITPVGISRDGAWMLASETAAILTRADASVLPPSLTIGGPEVDAVAIMRGHGPAAGSLPVVVMPILHGPNGEDGTMQGLLELADVPYVGSGVLGSALAMDKAKAKEVLALAGIPQANHVSAAEWDLDPALLDQIAERLGFPIFVKPSNMGSSIGVSRATDRAALDTAVATALLHDEWLVFEEAITGRELEMGVLGTTHPRTSVAGEIVPGAEFYDYEDKYVTGTAEMVIPAALPAGVAEEMSRLAVAAFRALRGEILGRADFFYEADGRGLLFNELNTLPGCTPVSMFPLLWEASGLAYPDLLDELVRLAIERHTRRRRHA